KSCDTRSRASGSPSCLRLLRALATQLGSRPPCSPPTTDRAPAEHDRQGCVPRAQREARRVLAFYFTLIASPPHVGERATASCSFLAVVLAKHYGFECEARLLLPQLRCSSPGTSDAMTVVRVTASRRTTTASSVCRLGIPRPKPFAWQTGRSA